MTHTRKYQRRNRGRKEDQASNLMLSRHAWSVARRRREGRREKRRVAFAVAKELG